MSGCLVRGSGHHRRDARTAGAIRRRSSPPVLRARRFSTGERRHLPQAKLAYATFGSLNAQRDNAVLIPSWYGSDHHGYDFLIGAGRALDPAKYFIVATEMFSNGFSSSPSNTPA